jgi:hypothetical protein
MNHVNGKEEEAMEISSTGNYWKTVQIVLVIMYLYEHIVCLRM